MKLKPRGMLIACEGIDGSGKSTLAQALATYFSHLPVLLTKEPGGTAFGMQLRTILQYPSVKRCPKSEFLLFAADRAQHFEEIIIPALNNGTLIITDRLADSSLVYQGYGRGLDLAILAQVNAWAMNSIKPDVILYVHVSTQIAFDRIKTRKVTTTTFEEENRDFFDKLIIGFDTLFAHRDDVIFLDGSLSPKDLEQEAVKKLNHWMHNHHFKEFVHGSN